MADDGVAESVEQRVRVLLHEIRQPLAAAFAFAESARSHPDLPAAVAGSLEALVAQLTEVSGAATAALRGDAADPSDQDLVDVDEVLASVLAAVRVTWPGRLQRRGQTDRVLIRGSRQVLRRAVANVVDNAVRAAGAGGAVTVTVHCAPATVRILIDDDGPGFGHVPGGTGLGLVLAQNALHSLGGSLSIGLPADRGRPGARVALSLPLAGGCAEDLREPVRAG